MLHSENALVHVFLSIFSEGVIPIPQLSTVISLIHPYQITLGPIRKFHLYYTSAFLVDNPIIAHSKNIIVFFCGWKCQILERER